MGVMHVIYLTYVLQLTKIFIMLIRQDYSHAWFILALYEIIYMNIQILRVSAVTFICLTDCNQNILKVHLTMHTWNNLF